MYIYVYAFSQLLNTENKLLLYIVRALKRERKINRRIREQQRAESED